MQPDSPAIQWYPGHMARAMRRLAEDIRLVDLVIEVADARVPRAGRNPRLLHLAAHRTRLFVLSRADTACAERTAREITRLRENGEHAVMLDAGSRASFTELRHTVAALTEERPAVRAIVLGIPNAGKSTIINGLVGRTVARTEDRAGVTRTAQWFRMRGTKKVEIMDTAGILVPKIDTAEAQWKLALVGAVPRARFDAEEVVTRFATWASANGIASVPDLASFAQTRGFMRHGTEAHLHNAAWSYIKDFNEGRFGRITLETESPK
jgi:ribosome biogenesis GTPase A